MTSNKCPKCGHEGGRYYCEKCFGPRKPKDTQNQDRAIGEALAHNFPDQFPPKRIT